MMAKRKKKQSEPQTRRYSVMADVRGFVPVGEYEGTGLTAGECHLDAEANAIGDAEPPKLCAECKKLFQDLQIHDAVAEEIEG